MPDEHVIHLGKLFANLQSLECLLRAYLLAVAQKVGSTKVGPDYWKLNVGDAVPVDEFTNYDSLGKLIGKFNSDIATRDPALTVDPKIVDIRDLLAHGRVASSKPDLSDMSIVKFDSPSGGVVRVVACAEMDAVWFQASIKLAFDQLIKVKTAYQKYAVT